MRVFLPFPKAFGSSGELLSLALLPSSRHEKLGAGKCQPPRAQPQPTKPFIAGILAVSFDPC